MSSSRTRRPASLGIATLAAALGVFGVTGCEAETVYYPVYVPPSGPPPVSCRSGVDEGAVDTDALLDLEAGYGVGATVEYGNDGTWRIALACDSLLSGAVCNWTVLVAPIDGTIEGYEGASLDDEDFIERYPTNPDSTEEDGVFLDALTADGIDAFTVVATPGTGITVNIDIDGYCAGPYLFWLDGGEVKSSSTHLTDLFPQD